MYLKDSKTVVVKIGSSLLIDKDKKIRVKWLNEFAKDIKNLKMKVEGYKRQELFGNKEGSSFLGQAGNNMRMSDAQVKKKAKEQQQKMMRGTDGKVPAPKGYDISGSAAWFAKADVGLTVHRPNPSSSPMSEIHVWKCRFSWVGKQGETELEFDVPTSTYRKYVPDEFLDVPNDYNDPDEEFIYLASQSQDQDDDIRPF